MDLAVSLQDGGVGSRRIFKPEGAAEKHDEGVCAEEELAVDHVADLAGETEEGERAGGLGEVGAIGIGPGWSRFG